MNGPWKRKTFSPEVLKRSKRRESREEEYDQVMADQSDEVVGNDEVRTDGGVGDASDGADAKVTVAVESPRREEPVMPSFRDKVRGDNRAKSFDEEDLFGALNENEGLLQVSRQDSWPAITTSPKLKEY